MTIRYLASIEGVFCAVAIRDVLGNFIANTQLIPERNIYAAVLNREQWDKIRAEYWGGLTLCEHGKLVPDVDFVASDGRVFLDMEQCLKHEEGAHRMTVRANDTLRLPAWRRDLDAKPRMSRDDIGKFLKFGVMRICVDTMPDHLTTQIIAQMSHIYVYHVVDYGFTLLVAGVHPEFELVRFDGVTEPLEYKAHLHTDGTIQIFCRGRFSLRAEFIAAGLCADVVQYNNGEFCNSATEFRYKQWLHETGKVSVTVVPTPNTHVEESSPKSLADKLFLACSENWTSVHFLASLLRETEAAILAEAEKDARLKLSATRKSICKL